MAAASWTVAEREKLEFPRAAAIWKTQGPTAAVEPEQLAEEGARDSARAEAC